MATIGEITRELVATGRGILVADDYPPAFRDLVVAAPGLEAAVAGVVVPVEAVGRAADGLRACGVLTGVAADTRLAPLAGCPGESVAEGLDSLDGRLRRAAAAGAAFARWRSRVTIDDGRPTIAAIRANALALSRFAAAVQEMGLVPIVEVRVDAAGLQPMSTVECVVGLVLIEVLSELVQFGIDPGGLVLAAAPVLAGPRCPAPVTPFDVAAATVSTLSDVVPAELGGLAIVDRGQPAEVALANLAAIRRRPTPWPLTFCFGPALLGPALATWSGVPDAQRAGRGRQALAQQLETAVAALAGIDDLERLNGPASGG